MSNIEKIRQEIERRKKENMYDNLPIIDSLPEEACKDSLQAPETCKENADSFTEDERIRQWLYDLVDEGAYLCERPFATESILAYLEKQKEQKPESCDCSRDEESYMNGIHHVLMNPEAYGLIKKKPAEQLGGTFTSYDMAKTFTEGQNYVIAHPEKFGLCKPAKWSEEDEKIAYTISDVLCSHVTYVSGQGTTSGRQYPTYAKERDWFERRFKFLRPQPKQEWSDDVIRKAVKEVGLTQHQIDWFKTNVFPPKQEWSEEDEHRRDGIIQWLREYQAKFNPKYDSLSIESIESLIDWLKSIRPSWKPSEQEKGALRTAIYVLTEERNFPKAAAQLQNILDAFEGKESRKDWKPSEEQMEAIENVIKCELSAGLHTRANIIQTLHNDLQKL